MRMPEKYLTGISLRLFLAAIACASIFGMAIPAALAQENREAAQPVSITELKPQTQAQTDTRSAESSTAEGRQDESLENEKARLAVNPVTGVVTSSGAGYEPLTGGERWKLYWKQNYWSVGAYFGPVFLALAQDQATNSPYQWGGGFQGYGKRVASRIGFSIAQGTFQAPVAALLHEDVRYIASPRRETKHRILHAIAFDFVTYNEAGHLTPNVAYLSSNYAAAAVSKSWFPTSQSLGRRALVAGSEQIGLNIGINLLQEFWTEATHLLPHHRE